MKETLNIPQNQLPTPEGEENPYNEDDEIFPDPILYQIEHSEDPEQKPIDISPTE